MQDKTPTRGFSPSRHVLMDGNAIPHIPRRHTPRAPLPCPPLVRHGGRARCPHRAAAPHGAVRGFASCDNRVWGTHAHYATIFARALHTATGRCGAMGTSRPTAITHPYYVAILVRPTAMPHALCPWGLPTARGGSPPRSGAHPRPLCAMPKNENGPEWKTIPTRGNKAQKAISPCCS